MTDPHTRMCHRHDRTYSLRTEDPGCPECAREQAARANERAHEALRERIGAIEDRLDEPPREPARWIDQSALPEVSDGGGA